MVSLERWRLLGDRSGGFGGVRWWSALVSTIQGQEMKEGAQGRVEASIFAMSDRLRDGTGFFFPRWHSRCERDIALVLL